MAFYHLNDSIRCGDTPVNDIIIVTKFWRAERIFYVLGFDFKENHESMKIYDILFGRHQKNRSTERFFPLYLIHLETMSVNWINLYGNAPSPVV